MYTASRARPSYAYEQGANYPPVETTRVELPYEKNVVRMFPASARYWQIPAGDRTQLYRALHTSPDDVSRAEEALSVWVVPLHSEAPLEPVSWAAGTPFSFEGLEGVMVAIINRTLEGDSIKLNVCFGSQEEITHCENTVFEATPPEAQDIYEEDDGGCNNSHNISTFSILLILSISAFWSKLSRDN